MLLRVSSAAIKSTSRRVLSTRRVMSSRFPMGVAHKYSFPFCFIICLFSRLTAGSCFPLGRGGVVSLDRGGLFKFGNFENRKGAAKPRPLCTPLGLFLSSARDSLFLFVDLCLYASVFSALCCADVVLFLHFLCGSLLARCLYSSILSALRCADVVLFLHFLCGSLLARCLYSSILSALRCADVVLFLHFLSDSLLARCLYSSIFNALRVAISRFESQARGGRLLVVTLAEPPSAR